jgi:dihydroflavonol-4-reductase
MSNDYKRSKWRAEQIAQGFAAKQSPVIIVNPSAPIGPRDVKPTPTGKVVLDFINRALPAYIECGLNWVHVRDVAVGHVLAAEKGIVGERYILGNAQGNWTLEETFKQLAEVSRVPAPKTCLPYWVALSVAYLSEAVARITGKPPKASLAGVRTAKRKMFFNPEKAIRELGIPQTPPRTAFAEAVEWFQRNGYVQKR